MSATRSISDSAHPNSAHLKGAAKETPVASGMRLLHSEELPPEQKELALSVRKLVASRVRMRAPGASPEEAKDLRARGMLGAVAAARRFVPGPGTSFPSYAIPFIEGGIKDGLKREGKHTKLMRVASKARAASAAGRAYLAEETTAPSVEGPRSQKEAELNALVERFFWVMLMGASDEPANPEELLLEQEERHLKGVVVDKAKGMLREHDWEVTRLSVMEDLPQQEVAAKMGITDRSVRRTVNRSLDTLRVVAEEVLELRGQKGT